MLVKALLTNGGNYEKSLRQRRWVAIGMLCIGLVGFVCYFLLVPDSSLPEYAQGFYLGAATGITAGALVLLLRTQYLMTHPKAQRKAKIKETDEREMQIVRTAAQAAGVITFVGITASLFVVLPLSMEAYYALACAMALYIASFLLCRLWLSKKL